MSQLSDKNILFRAHGEPPKSYELARKKNNILIDASCPIVLKLQRDIHKAYQNGEHIFIFGKTQHPEVIGLSGQANDEAVVFESPEQLKRLQIPEEITLFSQTTQSLREFYNAIDYLKNKGIKVKVRDTICRQVSNREHELEEFSRTHDTIVFVAGKNSSNGKILFQVCRNQNPNAHFISSPEEIQEGWFQEGQSVGICGATSTPGWLLEKVKTTIEAL